MPEGKVCVAMAIIGFLQAGQALWADLGKAVLADIAVLGGGGITAWLLIKRLLEREWEHTYDERLAKYRSDLDRTLEDHRAGLNRDLSVFGTRYSLFQSARFEVAREMYRLIAQAEAAIADYTQVLRLVPQGVDDQIEEEVREKVAIDALVECNRHFVNQELLLDDDSATSVREFLDHSFEALRYRRLGTSYVRQGHENLSKVRASDLNGSDIARHTASAATGKLEMGVDLVEKAEAISEKASKVKQALKEDLRRLIVAPEA